MVHLLNIEFGNSGTNSVSCKLPADGMHRRNIRIKPIGHEISRDTLQACYKRLCFQQCSHELMHDK